jgi:hypothetical protein
LHDKSLGSPNNPSGQHYLLSKSNLSPSKQVSHYVARGPEQVLQLELQKILVISFGFNAL